MATKPTERYIEAVGRRKTSTARVRITKGSKDAYMVNDKKLEEYFKTDTQIRTAKDAFSSENLKEGFSVSAHVKGGGLAAQAEAIRHGAARAVVEHDENLRGELKKNGYLKRDPRAKERKKFGLKKARKSSQWSKR